MHVFQGKTGKTHSVGLPSDAPGISLLKKLIKREKKGPLFSLKRDAIHSNLKKAYKKHGLENVDDFTSTTIRKLAMTLAA